MKEISELVNDSWKVKKPQIPKFWSHEGNKGTSLCPQLIQKKQNMSSMSQKTVPTTRQAMTRSFCSNSIKALLNQHLLCQVTHPPLKASVSSITDYSHRALATWNYKLSYRRLCFCHIKSISWCLTAGKDNSSNTGILKRKPLQFILPLQKGWFWLLWHYTNFCHVHKWWCVTLWLPCVILWN